MTLVPVTYQAGAAGSTVTPINQVMMNWVVPPNTETPTAYAIDIPSARAWQSDVEDVAALVVAFAELTTPDLAGFGIHVVRTLASGLQPIHFGDGLARLGGRRVFEAPTRMAQGRAALSEDELNPRPHPLA